MLSVLLFELLFASNIGLAREETSVAFKTYERSTTGFIPCKLTRDPANLHSILATGP